MRKKNCSKEDNLRKRVYVIPDKHKNWPKKDIVQHFKEEGVPKSTVYQILQRKENKKPPERKNRMTPPHCKMTREKVKRLKIKIDHKSGFSQRALAKTSCLKAPSIKRSSTRPGSNIERK